MSLRVKSERYLYTFSRRKEPEPVRALELPVAQRERKRTTESIGCSVLSLNSDRPQLTGLSLQQRTSRLGHKYLVEYKYLFEAERRCAAWLERKHATATAANTGL